MSANTFKVIIDPVFVKDISSQERFQIRHHLVKQKATLFWASGLPATTPAS
jgi:hypothetical protein